MSGTAALLGFRHRGRLVVELDMPRDVYACPRCAALVLDSDALSHESWHDIHDVGGYQ